MDIVAVTCSPEQYPKAAALAAGCDAYLLKPINTRKLSDQLNAANGLTAKTTTNRLVPADTTTCTDGLPVYIESFAV
jgi:CheY-like chemotaxis protein